MGNKHTLVVPGRLSSILLLLLVYALETDSFSCLVNLFFLLVISKLELKAVN